MYVHHDRSIRIGDLKSVSPNMKKCCNQPAPIFGRQLKNRWINQNIFCLISCIYFSTLYTPFLFYQTLHLLTYSALILRCYLPVVSTGLSCLIYKQRAVSLCTLLGLLFVPENGDRTLLRNIDKLLVDYPAPHPRCWHPFYSPPRESQI
jgi:hypothetical protein